MVDHLVVRDAQNPREKPPVVGIAALVDDAHGFDKGLLENIVCDIAVLDHHLDIVADTTAVAFDQLGNSIPVARKVAIKQFLITYYLNVHTLLLI